MGREFHRSERVADEVQRVLSTAIRDELDDPRLRLVTVTDVRVSRDLGHAKVYYSSLNDDDRDAIQETLEQAAGFLRGIVGRHLTIRTVPQLKFLFDDSLQRGQELTRLIDDAVASDRKRSEPGDD